MFFNSFKEENKVEKNRLQLNRLVDVGNSFGLGSLTKMPLNFKLEKPVNEAVEEEFKHDLEIIDNTNKKEMIKVSF